MGDGPNDRGLSRKHIFDAIDASLRRLGTDYVDLYQIHRFDYDTPIEETLEALHDIVKAGKARYIGASSMFAWQFGKMLATSDAQRLDAVRLDAEPLQPGLPRGRARDDAALPRGGHRRDSVEPAGARLSRRQPAAASDGGETIRAKTDEFAHELYYADTDFTIADRVVDARRAARREADADRAGLAARTARRHRADRRRVEARRTWTRRSARWRPRARRRGDARCLEEPYQPHAVARAL